MTLRIFIENFAAQDLEEHIDYIAAGSPPRAAKFIEAVQSAFARLADMPRIGNVREFRNTRLTGIRFRPGIRTWAAPVHSRPRRQEREQLRQHRESFTLQAVSHETLVAMGSITLLIH